MRCSQSIKIISEASDPYTSVYRAEALIMVEKQTILALGAGASSKFVFNSEDGHRIERVENVKDVVNYITRIDEMIERKRTAIATWL